MDGFLEHRCRRLSRTTTDITTLLNDSLKIYLKQEMIELMSDYNKKYYQNWMVLELVE